MSVRERFIFGVFAPRMGWETQGLGNCRLPSAGNGGPFRPKAGGVITGRPMVRVSLGRCCFREPTYPDIVCPFILHARPSRICFRGGLIPV